MEKFVRSETTFRIAYLISFTLILSTSLIYFVGFVIYSLYPGFSFNPSTGSQIEVFDLDQAGVLQPGDRITAVNGLAVETYKKNLDASFWEGVDVGDQVSINLMRDGQLQTVSWTIGGRTEAEFNERTVARQRREKRVDSGEGIVDFEGRCRDVLQRQLALGRDHGDLLLLRRRTRRESQGKS